MKPSGNGVIPLNSILTLTAVKRELGIGDAGLRAARRSGLKIRRVGRLGLIFSDDLAAWIRDADKTEKDSRCEN